MKQNFRFLSAITLVCGLLVWATVARAAPPNGSYSLSSSGTSYPILNPSGTHTDDIEGLHIVTNYTANAKGKFSGTFTMTSSNPEIPIVGTANGTIVGKIKGVNHNVNMLEKIKFVAPMDFGFGIEYFKVRIVDRVHLDFLSNFASGTVTLVIKAPGYPKFAETINVSESLASYLDGDGASWILTLNLSTDGSNTISGSGKLAPEEGSSYPLNVTGKYKEKIDASKVKGLYAHTSGLIKAMIKNMKTSGSTITGGTFKYKALGQKGRGPIN